MVVANARLQAQVLRHPTPRKPLAADALPHRAQLCCGAWAAHRSCEHLRGSELTDVVGHDTFENVDEVLYVLLNRKSRNKSAAGALIDACMKLKT